MRKILAAIVAIMFFGVVSLNYGELYAVFYDRFSNEKQSQISEIDFELMGNSMDQQLIDADGGLTLDENNEASVDVDFDVENTGTCDIYIRVAILPLILDKENSQIVYKLNKSSCEIQFCNEKIKRATLAYAAYHLTILMGLSGLLGGQNTKMIRKKLRELKELFYYDIHPKAKKVKKIVRMIGFNNTSRILSGYLKYRAVWRK